MENETILREVDDLVISDVKIGLPGSSERIEAYKNFYANNKDQTPFVLTTLKKRLDSDKD